jgi:hypothetical protein
MPIIRLSEVVQIKKDLEAAIDEGERRRAFSDKVNVTLVAAHELYEKGYRPPTPKNVRG